LSFCDHEKTSPAPAFRYGWPFKKKWCNLKMQTLAQSSPN
jgi:hypothetical protein